MNKRRKKKKGKEMEKEAETPIDDTEKTDEQKEPVEESEKEEVEEKKADADIIPKDQYLRLLAEFTNYKKRTAQEKDQLLNLARASVIFKLLPVLDDFSRLMSHMDGDNKDVIIDGIEGIFRKMMITFENEGVKKTESLNEIFDPNIHEAMMSQPTDDKEKDETVIMVYEEGYTLNDKLLRPAKVIVAQYPEEENNTTDGE